MKKLLLSLLAIVFVLGIVAGIGFTGYRLGYARGVQANASGQSPELRPFDRESLHEMPIREFGMNRDFQRGFGHGGFSMRGFGPFFFLRFLMQIAALALILWFAYWLFTRSGWRPMRTTQTIEAQPKPSNPEAKE